MPITQETHQGDEPQIDVVMGQSEPVRQPDTFQFCPLGVQCYCRQEVPEFSVMEFRLNLPQAVSANLPGEPVASSQDAREEITCFGIVVNCREENDSLYRIWIKFLDLPTSVRSRIQCLAKSADSLCPFCENF